ncbi:MAG: acyl-CoA reductase [Candidatus Baltobacteraceae bacterium]
MTQALKAHSLRAVPVRAIVRALSDAAARWSDADFPPRVRATDAIAARTGYSIPVVEYALDRLFFSITEEALLATIQDELGGIDLLDDFSKASRPRGYARGFDRICLISSRTTIGVALVPAVFALCAKSDVLVKDREDGLIAAFFATLTDELEQFAVSASAQQWESAHTGAHDLSGFDLVVAFGKDATLDRIREQCSPHARFIGYGSRASAGYVAIDHLDDERRARAIGDGAARDLLLYDSEGCLSLHVLFIERGGKIGPLDFAALLSESAKRATIEFPLGARSPAGTAKTGSYRNLAAFRSTAGRGAVFSDAECSHVIALDPPLDEPPPFLPRVAPVIPVDTPADALAYLRRHSLALEGFALSDERADLISMAVDAGASRITTFGQLQNPPLASKHGGRPRIAEFIQWIDWDA